jgi:superfamily II DNA or RNA helicase/HKD family nuclease
MPKRGLHETLITAELEAQLASLDPQLVADRTGLRPPEAADRLALHLGRLLRQAVESFPEKDRTEEGIKLARTLVAQIHAAVADSDLAAESPITPGTLLRAIAAKLPDGTPETITSPLIPLLDTTLLTNAPGEPRVGQQIQTEIHSADRIDVVMAFIRRSGIRPLLDDLQQHATAGRSLRVLTTTYTNSTEAAALDQLAALGAQVRVSYDETNTRLHAKAWLFHRDSGFSTAYIGSSNLTHSAQISGLEWNVRVSGARNPDVIDKVGAVFESYWAGGDFVPYDATEFAERTRSVGDKGPTVLLSPLELRPEPFQERLLEQIALSRTQGHHRNLLVSATGTGKTVMAAIDYLRLRTSLPRARLLVVAHREEILTQSLATFRQGLRDQAFGELWVGGARPSRFEHVFASIQSLNAAGFASLPPDHFDVVIIDEFHHAAAPSYRALLHHVQPVELLGLTATPERSDGLDILTHFDNRIAAELRLWDAIDQHRLTPFLYFGVHDGLDLREVPWKRGRGYDIEGLTGVLTASDATARLVLKELQDHAENPARMRVLGFCVSVAHARFMARVFNDAGLASIAIWGDSPDDERKAALRDLAEGRVQVVFSVDLFNEGIDVPTVDTLLLLRPTDSPTLFLQQLGRGLRKSHGKAACTVLDFVGQHRREFRFDRRFRALLGGSRKDLTQQIEGQFPFLPAGCHMELDAVASKIVLDNIKAAVPSMWRDKAKELSQIAASQASGDVSLRTYLEESGLELDDVYAGNRTWSDLRAEARLPVATSGPSEEALRRACGRLLHIDDAVRIEAYRALLTRATPPAPSSMTERERRLLRMLVAPVLDKVANKDTNLAEGSQLLWQHPQVRTELLELLDVLTTRIDHVHTPLATHPDVPLQVHARYTRLEILAAFGVGEGAKVAPWQSGVYWAKDAAADLLAFTLDKTSGQFSPTTRYRDYAINRDLIHWESQSVTRADSETGQRYQHHVTQGTSVMLFARLRADDRAFWFLGLASYLGHTGERPLAVTWKLDHQLPGDVFASFAAAVA